MLKYCDIVKSNINANTISVTTTEIIETVAELQKTTNQPTTYQQTNNATGYDGLISEHFQFASTWLSILLAIVLESFLEYVFCPDGLMITMIVRILKNKHGDIAPKNYNRDIAIAAIVSKIRIQWKSDNYFWKTDN